MTPRRACAIAVWYEVPGRRQAHAVLLHDQPFQKLIPATTATALCGAEVPEGSPLQFDTDYHDCAACKAALGKGA
jgi:hypothetical protein